MNGERRRGPGRLSAGEIAQFVATRRLASLCVEDEAGELRAVPAWAVSKGGDTVDIEMPDTPTLALRPETAACVVADEFETYEGIRGVILRGQLTDDHRLLVEHKLGFTFEGTTVA